MIDNKIISLIYKTILITISLISLFFMAYYYKSTTLGYFTNLSNICVFFMLGYVWIKTLKDVIGNKTSGYNTYLLKYKGIATLCICVTGIIYMLFLADYTKKATYYPYNLMIHYIVPIMTVLDFFLFDKRGSLKAWYPMMWVVVVAMYLPYIFIRQYILKGTRFAYFSEDSRFPYFFLDIDELGYLGVGLWIFGIIAVFTLISYLFYLWDHIGGDDLDENTIHRS